MNTRSNDEKFRTLTNPDELLALHEKASSSVYRQSIHIQPVSGLLNDPNGFIYFNDTWHLFYQWCPWGAFHGLKHWYHVTSEDLITWKNEGLCIRPDTYFDNKGVFSGTALPYNDQVYLYYTGIHREGNRKPKPYTCMARLSENGRARKFSGPLFGPSPDYTENQRDPKIIYDARTRKYYILLGAQTKDKKGCIIFYESDNQNSGWKFRGQLKVPGFEDFGYMWECPSIERISGHDVLIFCPQGVHLEGHGEGKNHSGYIIGTMDYGTLTFTPDGAFHELDFGFDSYAAQCVSNLNDPSKTILMSWMGLPDGKYPTDKEGWSGCLTLPRELTIRHRRLIQRPVAGLRKLRKDTISPGFGMLPSVAEINISIYPKDFDMQLFSKADGTGGFDIRYNSSTREITIDRSKMDNRFDKDFGEVRTRILDNELTQLVIYIDHSSIEIFVNNGDAVFTSRLFPTEAERYYQLSECTSISIWEMSPAVTDDFII